MLDPHPDRQQVLAEMHARPIVMIPGTCRLRRLVFSCRPGKTELSDILPRLQNWCAENDIALPDSQTRQHTIVAAGYEVTWEFHTEFLTLSWTAPLEDAEVAPDGIGLEITEGLDLVCATRIDVIAGRTVQKRLLDSFNLPSLCHAAIETGNGQIATDFVEDENGFVRFEFAAGGLSPLRRAILARRLMEIETYSKMALLGLPPVRAAGQELKDVENRVSQAIRDLQQILSIGEARQAMDDLNRLSLSVAALSERLNYRIAASQAYGAIIEERLSGLGEQPTPSGSTIHRFVVNRVGPAIRTMIATEKRLAAAAAKIERTVLMLNTRNGLELEIQNSEILGTISQTAKSQFRLQQTVEGLSVIAISYYLLGILGYILSGPLYTLHWNKEWVLSAIAPVALVLVWLASKRLWGARKE